MKLSLLWTGGALACFATLVARPARAQEDQEQVLTSEEGSTSVAPPIVAAPKVVVTPKIAPPTESYAWQTLAADGATLAIATTAIATASPGSQSANASYAIGFGSFGAWFVASPIIHASHGRWEAAAGSLALRVLGAPAFAIGGAILGTVICPGGGNREWGCLTPAVYGFGAGAVTGIVAVSAIDANFLAREPAKESATKESGPRETEPSRERDRERRTSANAPVARPKPYKPDVRFTPAIDPFNKTATVGVGGTW